MGGAGTRPDAPHTRCTPLPSGSAGWTQGVLCLPLLGGPVTSRLSPKLARPPWGHSLFLFLFQTGLRSLPGPESVGPAGSSVVTCARPGPNSCSVEASPGHVARSQLWLCPLSGAQT